MTTYNGVPFCLSDEAIMEPLWRLRRPFQKELTFTRWKDGIDIDYPTPELRALAEHFYRAGMAAMAERAERECYSWMDGKECAAAIRALLKEQT